MELIRIESSDATEHLLQARLTMVKHYYSLTNLLIIVFISLIVCAELQAATVYRWVDKNGKTHFSQTPPNADTREYSVRFAKEKVSAEEIAKKDQQSAKDAEDADAAKNGNKEKALTPQQRLADIEKARMEQSKVATEKAKERDERIKKCQKAQSNMRNIEQGGRIYDVNKDGEREYWDDSKREEKKTETQDLIDKFCN